MKKRNTLMLLLVPLFVCAQNKTDYEALIHKAQDALTKKDTVHAQQIADQVIVVYLSRLNEREFYTIDHIRFIAQFTNNPGDKYFNMFRERTGQINNVIGKPTFAQDVIDKVLIRSEIQPVIQSAANTPDWKGIVTNLTQKYDPLSAQRAVIRAEIGYYNQKDWKRFCKALAQFTSFYGDHTNSELMDRNANLILQHSDDRNDLQAALAWSKMTITTEPENKSYQNTFQAIQQKLK